MTKSQLQIIEKHNAEMKIIADTSIETGLDKCLLFYAAVFGIIGIDWVVKPTELAQKGEGNG